MVNRQHWLQLLSMLSLLIVIGCMHIKPVERAGSSSGFLERSKFCIQHEEDIRVTVRHYELVCKQDFIVNPPIVMHWIDRKIVQSKSPQEEAEDGMAGAEGHPEQIDNEPDKPIVYLTFDDGPGKYTDGILDLLKEEGILATFFVLGVQLEKYPETTKRLVSEGHSIGNHSYNHEYKEIYMDFDLFAEQYSLTNQLIVQLTDIDTRLLRAPGGTVGNFDTGYYEAVTEAGFHVFDWNVDSRDSSSRKITAEEILHEVMQSKLYDKAIVLLHDSNLSEQTYIALPQIISYYREQGYQFAPITEMTEPLTFRIAEQSKWQRDPVTEQQRVAFTEAIQNKAIYRSID